MPGGLEHFNDAVPLALRERLKKIADTIHADFFQAGVHKMRESYGCSRVSEIHGKPIDGFFPLQLGGFDITDLFRSDRDESYHFSAAQSKFVEDSTELMHESFALENGLKDLPPDWVHSDLPDDFREEFFIYESEWLEPALLRVELWVDDSRGRGPNVGSKCPLAISLRLSLNYADAPYFRARDDETLFETSFPTKKLPSPDAIVSLLKKAVEVKKP